MSTGRMLLMVLLMAVVTYVIRVIPMAFFRKKITSNFIKSLLYYIPYAVLSAMTFPYIFYSTNSIYSALCGTVVALIASVSKRSLTFVALVSCAFVLITSLII